MTIETEQPMVADHPHYVRMTSELAYNMYGAVKNSAPLLKAGFESVESQVPVAWIERFTAASDPVIDQLDNQIDQLSRVVNTRVIEPVHTKVIVPVKDAAAQRTDQLRSTVATRVVEPVKEVAAKTSAMYTARGEELSAAVTTRVISPVQDKVITPAMNMYAAVPARGEWKSVRGDLSKKAVARLEQGLVLAKEFSATRGKDIIHFDLIQYSTEVLDNASAAAKPLYEPLQEKLAAAVVKVNSTVTSLQEAVAQRSVQTTEQYEAVRAELVGRLHAAMSAARELSSTSVKFVQERYSAVQTGELKLNDAVAYIMASPALFLEVKSKADFDTSKRAIDNAKSLLAAVKEVVFEAQKAAVVAPPVEVEETAE
jgi:hypothetical protein